MANFLMNIPLLKTSTAPFAILSEDGSTVGEVRRFYENRAQRWIDFIADKLFIHVAALTSDGQFRIELHQQLSKPMQWIRDEWRLKTREGNDIAETTLQSITKVKTNPQIVYQIRNRSIIVKKDFLDKTYRFQDMDTGRILAETGVSSLVPFKQQNREIQMAVFDTEIQVCKVACIYYAMYLAF